MPKRAWVVLLCLLAGLGCDAAAEGEGSCGYSCPLSADETCDGCGERVATCCYGEGNENAALVPQVMAACEGDPGCRACCAECAEKSCADLIADGGCPALLEEAW